MNNEFLIEALNDNPTATIKMMLWTADADITQAIYIRNEDTLYLTDYYEFVLDEIGNYYRREREIIDYNVYRKER